MTNFIWDFDIVEVTPPWNADYYDRIESVVIHEVITGIGDRSFRGCINHNSVKARMKKEEPTIFAIWEKIERSRQGDLKAETSDEDKEILTAYLDKLGQLTGAKGLIDGRKIRVSDNM